MDTDNARARFNMIAQQIQPWEVLDQRVLEAMGEVPREAFVPAAYQGLAYADVEIPIGDSRVMLAPKVLGRLLQALRPSAGDRVLELSIGTGYGSACLARLGAQVIGLESDPELAASARERLAGLGIGQVEVRVADGLAGPTPGAPFDAIAANGSVPELARLGLLESQLAPGGRLFCVVGEGPAMTAWLVTRIGAADWRRESLFETSVPALPDCPEPESFCF